MNRFVPVTDPVQIAAIMAPGKYREHLPLWVLAGDTLWVVAVAQREVGK